MRKNIFISILAGIILLTGCKKIGSIYEPQPEPDGPPLVTPIGIPVGSPVSKTIGSAGGSLFSPDGKMELNFPSGALIGNTAITIQPVTNFCPGGIDLAYHLMPDNIKFSKPVTLTYHYTDDDVDGSHPYFLYIAYQDSSQGWKADFQNRNVDTIAKTVSLGISHFSLWSVGDNLHIHMDPDEEELYETDTREISAMIYSISAVAGSDPSNGIMLPQSTLLSRRIVKNWALNGETPGKSPAIGIISDTLTLDGTGKYTAPVTIKAKRTVRISVEINYPIVFFNNGKVVAKYAKFILFKNITLLPSEFEYSVNVHLVDGAIAGYNPGQVYEDKASFDLSIKKMKDNMGLSTVLVLVSNFKNYKPSVTPLIQTYHDYLGFSSFTWEWIPDDIGVTNITGVTLEDYNESASTVTLKLVHTGAMDAGFNWSTSLGNSGSVAPKPSGGSSGMPRSLRLKLERKDQTDPPWIKITTK